MKQNIKKIKKIKRKRAININLIITILLILMCCVSYGYGLWETGLQMSGTITAKGESKMPVNILTQGSENEYVVTDFTTSEAVISNQYIEENVVYVNYTLKTTTGKPRTTTITVNFKNDKEVAMTNGTSTSELSGTTSFFNGTPTITTPTEIAAGDTGSIVIKFVGLKFNNISTSSATCKVKLSYQLNGETVEFYIQLNFGL